MANSLQTSSLVVNEALSILKNKIVYAKAADRHFEEYYNKEFVPGSTIDIRRPVYFKTQSGPSITPSAIIDRIQPLTITEYIDVSFQFTSQELAYFLYDNKKRSKAELETKSQKVRSLISSAMAAGIQDLEKFVAGQFNTYLNYFPYPSTPGTLLNSFAQINNAKATMDNLGMPVDKRFCIVSNNTAAAIQNSLSNNFSTKYREPILEEGYIGYMAGAEFAASTFVTPHTAGIGAGGSAVGGWIAAGTVRTTTGSGNTLPLQGLQNSTAGTFKKGDIIYVLGAESWNMAGNISAGMPVQLRVTEDAGTTTGGGNLDLAVEIAGQAIISDATNPFQNVSIPIPSGSAVYLAATHTPNVMFTREALCVAIPPLSQLDPKSVGTERYTDSESGISVRFTHGADITNDINIQRLDMIVGVSVFPDYGIRIPG